MEIGRFRAHQRGLVIFTAACLAGVCVSCDRGTGEQKDAGQTGVPIATFKAPDVDVSALTPGLQKRIDDARRAAEESPRNPDNVGVLGSLYYVQGFAPPAAVCFEHAATLSPEAAHWHYYRALAYEGQRELDSARSAYERAMELDPSYLPFQVKLAQLISDQDPDRAAALCQSVLEANHEHAAAILTLGMIASKKGDNQKAIEYAQQSLDLMPNFREAHVLLSSIYGALGRNEEAQSEAKAARAGKTPVVDDPLFESLLRRGISPEILFRDIELLIRRGALPQAETALEIAADADRQGDATLRATALLRGAQGRYDEAAEAYRKVIVSHPDLPWPHIALAEILGQAGKHAEADAEFVATLQRSPDDIPVLESYVRYLVSHEQGAKAEELMRGVVERNGEGAQFRFLLGALLSDLGKDVAAREQLEYCLKLAPGHPVALWTLGAIAERAGDQKEALRCWAASIESAPNFVQSHVSLAQAAIVSHNYDDAIQHFRAALKVTPDSAQLINALAWLLATSPSESVRNGEEAIKLAERACLLTQNRTHAYLDTLAAAYAEKGRFDDAVRTAGKAIEIAKSAGSDAADYDARLRRYQQKQPYRVKE